MKPKIREKVNLGRQSEGMKPKMHEKSKSWSPKKRNETQDARRK
ncbi:hypothetical protein [Heyndrickxia sporothermodurans]|uniref:Uncharacterized protein n=1 Tax=Heyndrickxia sporothermodurans TaxID=46224 RepID=A0A150L9C0_9BACI|nr:hypothetical protein [Heyndrickxia sporothermodurans]KYD08855.1 hypothetical protein B4102_1862 [Heyndrickxia sporothermodurans]MED3652048.1 hypothetical protein [Heyndrickxia sporothermodurans]MED3697565.1 hypothetical protein [Heyndrickxia sporothermodurans]